MSYEILYTSAPSGLKPGSSGYCTVQGSRGIPAPAVDLLESLSGYRHVFTPGSPEATHNPVNWGHYLIRIAGRVEHVLSRVGDCELDYTGRSNKLAHHLVVDAPTTATLPGGPAWFLSRPGLMYDQWDGTVSHLGTPRIPPPERRTAGQCAAWGGATGDAGWGGVLAESFLADPERKVFVVYAPGTNVLALFEEAIALLPEHRRWDVTFATYGAALPKTVDCLWSGLVAGSPEVAQSHRFVNALRIDLTDQVGRAVGGPLVELARTGATTSPTRLTARPASKSPQPIPVAEPVYEAGYQPVPPPPVAFGSQPAYDEPLPPSLPEKPKRRRGTIWIATIGLACLSLAAIGTAVFLRSHNREEGDEKRTTAEATSPESTQPSNSVVQASPSDPAGTSGDAKSVPEMQPETVTDPEAKTATDDKSKKKPSVVDSDGSKMETQPGEKSDAPNPSPRPQSGADSGAKTAAKESSPPKDLGPRRVQAKHGIKIPKLNSTDTALLPPHWEGNLRKVKRATLLCPIDHSARQKFARTARQNFDDGTILVDAAQNKSFSQQIFSLSFTKDGDGPISLKFTPKVALDENQSAIIRHSAVLVSDADMGRDILILLNRPIDIPKFHHESEEVLQATLPEDLQGFAEEIGFNDVVGRDLKITFKGTPLNLKASEGGELVAEIPEELGGLVKEIALSPAPTLSGLRSKRTVTLKSRCIPKMEVVKDKLNERHDKLEEHWRQLQGFFSTARMDQTDLREIRVSPKAGDRSEFEAAAKVLKDLVEMLPNTDEKDPNAAMKKNIARSTVTNYIRELGEYRQFSQRKEEFKGSLSVIAGRFVHPLIPIRAIGDDSQTSSKDALEVVLFSVGRDVSVAE